MSQFHVHRIQFSAVRFFCCLRPVAGYPELGLGSPKELAQDPWPKAKLLGLSVQPGQNRKDLPPKEGSPMEQRGFTHGFTHG